VSFSIIEAIEKTVIARHNKRDRTRLSNQQTDKMNEENIPLRTADAKRAASMLQIGFGLVQAAAWTSLG
jgi:hypothetical protein